MSFPSLKDQCSTKFTPETPHFYKIILDDTDTQKLRIPNKFAKPYGSEISSPVSLKVLSGESWKVKLTKCADGTWLDNGWSEFSKHYSLSHGSFLSFRYEGNCNFHVIIGDKSATEISYPYSKTHGTRAPNGGGFQDHMKKVSNDEVLDDIPPPKKTRKRSSSPTRPRKKKNSASREGISVKVVDGISPSKKIRVRSRATSSQPGKKINSTSTTCVKDSAIKSSGVKCEIPEPDLNVNSAKRRGKRPQQTKVCRSKGTLRNEERDNALHLASSFRSQNPFFMVVMQPSYICGKKMAIPVKFYRRHLSNRSGDAILYICYGKSSSFVLSTDPRPRFNSGWRTFVKENNLEVGDVCVFDLINQTKITFNIEIYRRPVQDAEAGPIPAIDGSKCVLPSAPQEFSPFKSENPFFLSSTKPSNIWRVNVPCSFIKGHIKKDVVNLTHEDGGKLWPVKVLSYESRMRRDAYLCGGWRAFASKNSVKVGDMCAFELINKEDGVLRVHNLSKSAK